MPFLRRAPLRVSIPLFVAAVLIAVALFGALLQWLTPKRPIDETVWGTTYSAYDARSRGLDPQETYLAILDELQPKRLRLVSYWNATEPAPNRWDFHDLDFQVEEAEARGIPYTIVVGRRVPRWPECFSPRWTESLPEVEQQAELYEYLTTVVERYDDGPHLDMWQVENETNVGQLFGDCPAFSADYLPVEVALVRSLSSKPILLTGGGEILSQGLQLSGYGDVYGTSLYRSTNFRGVFIFKPIPSIFYGIRGAVIEALHPQVDRVIVSELQAEPWSGGDPDITMSHESFDDRIVDAQKTGLSEVYFWGAEWWYQQKLAGDPYFWNQAKQVFAESRD